MDRYHIALFIHVLALVVAGGVTAVTKLAAGRRARARTAREALEWFDLLTSSARFFPLCLLTFVVTGAYMLSFHSAQTWGAGFVVAGLVGSALLLASGTFLGTRARAARPFLAAAASRGADQPAPPFAPPRFIAALPVVNSAIALSVMFDMIVKPVSVVGALSVVGVGIALGALAGSRRPRRAAERAEAGAA